MVRACACLFAGKTSIMRSTGFARVVGVQRAEDEQTGLRRGERERDRFEVAHFTDEHDVGILAQRGFQARSGR